MRRLLSYLFLLSFFGVLFYAFGALTNYLQATQQAWRGFAPLWSFLVGFALIGCPACYLPLYFPLVVCAAGVRSSLERPLRGVVLFTAGRVVAIVLALLGLFLLGEKVLAELRGSALAVGYLGVGAVMLVIAADLFGLLRLRPRVGVKLGLKVPLACWGAVTGLVCCIEFLPYILPVLLAVGREVAVLSILTFSLGLLVPPVVLMALGEVGTNLALKLGGVSEYLRIGAGTFLIFFGVYNTHLGLKLLG